jgi:hypothetical protein
MSDHHLASEYAAPILFARIASQTAGVGAAHNKGMAVFAGANEGD